MTVPFQSLSIFDCTQIVTVNALEYDLQPCHWEIMTQKRKSAGTGGGIFIAIFMLIGTAIGIYAGQPSIGLLGGVGAGIVAAGLYWLLRRG